MTSTIDFWTGLMIGFGVFAGCSYDAGLVGLAWACGALAIVALLTVATMAFYKHSRFS